MMIGKDQGDIVINLFQGRITIGREVEAESKEKEILIVFFLIFKIINDFSKYVQFVQ